MLNYTRARVEDVRALAGAIVVGSGAGLLVGAGYLALGAAHPISRPAPATASASPLAALSRTRGPAVQLATPSIVAPVTLRDRFKLAGGLARAVGRAFPFDGGMASRGDQTCLAEAVYFEARGEAAEGQQAVAQVVLNRVRHPAFPKSVCAVVHQRSSGGCQFSFACSDRQAAVNSVAWRRAETVASAALHGAVMAAVGNATHFQSVRSGAFAGLLKVAQIGAHAFYRFSGRAGAAPITHPPSAPIVLAAADGRVRVEFAAFKIAPTLPAPTAPVAASGQASAPQAAAVGGAAASHAADAALADKPSPAGGATTPLPAADAHAPVTTAPSKPEVAPTSALTRS